MGVWLIRLFVMVATTAIARGVVAALGLDAKVARLITIAATSANIQAIAWVISGLFGLICIILWIAFDVPQRITDLISGSRPALGSLSFVNVIAEIGKHQQSGRISARISVELTNGNDFLIAYRATVRTEVNGMSSGPLSFNGLVPAHQNRYLIAPEIPNVPPPQPNQNFISGSFDYDVTYFAAPNSPATRRTSKHVEFSTDQGRQDKPPGTQIRVQIITRLSNEIEE